MELPKSRLGGKAQLEATLKVFPKKMGFFTLTHPRPSIAALKLQQARKLAPDFPLEQQRAPRQGIFLGAEQDITPQAEQTRVGNALPTELLLSALPADGAGATSHIQGDL